MSKDKSSLFDERTCPVCNKKFFKPVESIYKYRDSHGHLKYTCSYTCWVSVLKKAGKW